MFKDIIKELFYSILTPKQSISFTYWRCLGRRMNWKNPTDLNEKINWLKLHSDMNVWADLADKHKVREFVRKKGLGELLVEEYGIWSSAYDIDFDLLPDKFVLKTNHGCGSVILVEDKSELDVQATLIQLDKWLNTKYGKYQSEFHYTRITPMVMAEQMLENDSKQSTSIVDYKVWCFNGRPYCICVCSDRKIGYPPQLGFYDLEWNYLPDYLDGPHITDTAIIDKPPCLEKMLEAASSLSAGLPQVRVDFYVSGGKLYFGEMTLTSLGGFMNYIKPEYLLEMGKQIDLTNV